MPRFEIESKCIQEAFEDRFATYKAWLRDSETGKVYTFEARTREQVKEKARKYAIRIQANEGFAFVCPSNHIGVY